MSRVILIYFSKIFTRSFFHRLIIISHELGVFFLKLVWSSKFAAGFFSLLLISKYTSFGLPRYDFLFLTVLGLQGIFLLLKIEKFAEIRVITCFHFIGLVFELFKTHPSIGAWSYPEFAWFKVGTVPLYSGFMYAAVASFVLQSWHILEIKLNNYPPSWITIPLSIAIYSHFFLKHFGLNFRNWLLVTVFITYWRTRVFFKTTRQRQMSLSVGFGLVGVALWVAENISTRLGAWQYPHQLNGWQFVGNSKIFAWFLLYVVSFIVVTNLLIFRQSKHVSQK